MIYVDSIYRKMTYTARDLREIIDGQISLTVEAIWAGLHAVPDPQSVSFRHILNRIMILVQSPITFILFIQGDDGALERQYTFNKHPRHHRDINAQGDIASKRDMFRLFGTKYFLLVLNATSPYEFSIIPPLDIDHLPEKPNNEDIVRYKMTKITNPASYKFYGQFSSIIHRSLAACKDWPQGAAIRASKLRPAVKLIDHDKFFTALRSNTTQYYLDGYGVVDRVYRKIKKGIESISSGNEQPDAAKLTNFILFVRDYAAHDGYIRHASYNYRLQILICSNQRSDLKDFFGKHMRGNMAALKKAVRMEKVLREEEIKKPYYKKLARDAALRFFEILNRPTGDEDLLKILETPFGVAARSMADPVFDGVTFFRDPFTEGGLSRCFPENEGAAFKELNLEQQDDVLRITICRHLFEAMAPQIQGVMPIENSKALATNGKEIQKSPVDRLQIMLNPVELGGRVWCVIGHLTRSIEPTKTLTDSKTINLLASYWLQNYHIYQTINERAKKNLRVYMSQLYEATVGNIYQEETLKFLGRLTKSAVVQSAVNERLESLSCLFPYDVVQIELEPRGAGEAWPQGPADGGDRASRRAVFSEGVVSVVSKEPNFVFPPAPSLAPGVATKFVSETDVAVAMSDAILRGSIEAYMKMVKHSKKGSDATS